MKVKLEKKYIQIGFTIFLTSLALLCVVFFIWNNNTIKNLFSTFNHALAPVYYGLIIAYILAPILNFIEKKILIPLFHKLKWFEPEKDKKRIKHIRVFSVIFTLVVVFLFLYIFFSSVIPELIKSIQSIVVQYPNYTRNLVTWINKIVEDNPDLQNLLKTLVYNYYSETDNWLNEIILPSAQKLIPNVGDVLIGLSTSLMKFLGFIWNIVIGIIISIYVLFSKESFGRSCTRLCYAFLETKNANKFVEAVRFTHKTFIGFLSGKVLDSLIIGVISFVVLSIMKMPYTVLISMIIGITNVIPFFGPFLGAIPSAFILLMVDPKLALYFLIYVVVLQQFDGNFLGPKILSSSTGVTTFWIICSITAFSGIFGVVGMLIAVPVTAVFFAFLNNMTNGLLTKKKLPTDVDEYNEVGSITPEGEIIRYEHIKVKKVKNESKFEKRIKTIASKCINWFKNRFKKKNG